MAIKNKYDFIMFFTVKDANPNGDPLNKNKPRVDFNGCGEVSDVCIKRKLRNRMMDLGENIFVQSNEHKADKYNNLQERFEACREIIKEKDSDRILELSNAKWIDVRSFGQVFNFKKSYKLKKSISLGVRGPVSIHPAVSEEEIKVFPRNSKVADNNYVVDFATYKLVGSINSQLSEVTGFNNRDAEILKKSLLSLFKNDSSALRPEGSMEVNKLYWFKHRNKLGDYPSSKIHNCISLEVQDQTKKEFSRYKIIENIPDTFKRIENNNILVELID